MHDITLGGSHAGGTNVEPATIERKIKSNGIGNVGSISKYAANAWAIHSDNSPKYFIFFVTSRCNATCDFCHYTYQINDKARKSQELTVDEITEIAKNYGKISKLSFSGGEPFIRDDLDEVMEAFIEHCDPQIIDIPTNGSYPERIKRVLSRVLPKLAGRVLDIQLSIDGLEDTHNTIRGIPGLFKKVLKSYAVLADLREEFPNLRIKMNLVFVNDNKAEIDELIRFFENDYDFDRFHITYPHGESVDFSVYDQVEFSKYKIISQDIQKHYRLRNRWDLHSLIFRAVKMVRDKVISENHAFRSDMGAVCKAGERIVVLDDIGEIYPCEPLWESVGNVRNADFSVHKILAEDAMRKFKDKYLGENKCTCAWGCVAMQKSISTPSLYPRILYNLGYLMMVGGRGLSKRLRPS